MSDSRHSYVGMKQTSGKRIPIARCSCGWSHEGNGAGAQLITHLRDCPDETDLLPISEETEEWAARTYDDRTCTLDEWKARR